MNLDTLRPGGPRKPERIDLQLGSLRDGIVAWWMADRAHAGQAALADLSGNGYTAALSGATWAHGGERGSVLSFVTNDSLTASTLSLSTKTDYTLMAWVYPRTISASDNSILTADGTSLLWDFNDADSIRYRSEGATDGAEWAITPADFLNRWSRLVLTHEAATNDHSLWVDGQFISTPNTAGNGETRTGFNVGIREGGTAPFDGYIDDFRMYSRIVSPAEIYRDWSPSTRFELVTSPRDFGLLSLVDAPAGAPTGAPATPYYDMFLKGAA